MRRTLLVDARLPWGSGIGRYVRNIIPRLAALMPAVQITLLIGPGDVARAEEISATCFNVEISVTDIQPFSLAEQTRLSRYARGYDLTWFTNYWVPLRWPGPFVVTVHDLMHLSPDFPASKIKQFAAKQTFAKVRRDAAHIVFVSRFSKREFARIVGTPKASTVVHHGIDHLHFAPAGPMEVRERTALVVGAAKEHKNLMLVLEAWERAALDQWKLIFVTPKDSVRSSIDLAERAARASNVTIMQGVSDSELAALYARAGFVLVPSRYEGFGLPLLEAMLAGAPIVCSTAEALVEVASGARLPFVSPFDREGWVLAMRQMAAEFEGDGDMLRLATANQTHARGFTWETAALQTSKIMARALAVSQ